MHQPARRPGIGIVVDREDPSVDVPTDAERVPETGGDTAKVAAVGRTPKDAAAFAAAGERRAVRGDELVIGAEVLTEVEEQIAFGVEGQPGKTVVRIVALRVQENDAFVVTGLAVALSVAQP